MAQVNKLFTCSICDTLPWRLEYTLGYTSPWRLEYTLGYSSPWRLEYTLGYSSPWRLEYTLGYSSPWRLEYTLGYSYCAARTINSRVRMTYRNDECCICWQEQGIDSKSVTGGTLNILLCLNRKCIDIKLQLLSYRNNHLTLQLLTRKERQRKRIY